MPPDAAPDPGWSLDTLPQSATLDKYLRHLAMVGGSGHFSMLERHRIFLPGPRPSDQLTDELRKAAWKRQNLELRQSPEYARLQAVKARVRKILANRYNPWNSLEKDPRSGRARHEPERKSFDARHDVRNLIQHAESEGVAVTWHRMRQSLGGFVARPKSRQKVTRDLREVLEPIDPEHLQAVVVGDVIIALNPDASWISTFEVLVHELAHLLLGHVGPMEGTRRGRLAIEKGVRAGWLTGEFEAISVSYVVACARGAPDRDTIAQRLEPYHLLVQALDGLVAVSLIEIVTAAEVLTAWCASGLDGMGVLGPTGAWGPSEHGDAA